MKLHYQVVDYFVNRLVWQTGQRHDARCSDLGFSDCECDALTCELHMFRSMFLVI